MSTLQNYANAIKKFNQSKKATEKTYRPALYPLFAPVDFHEEPKKEEGSIPDGLLLSPANTTLCAVETKDYNDNLGSPKYEEQFSRYKAQYSKLIITNYKDFEFYKDTSLVKKVTLFDDKFKVDENAYKEFTAMYSSFTSSASATAPTATTVSVGALHTKPEYVAKLLAEKTRHLKDELFALKQENASTPDYPLVREQEIICKTLLQVSDKEFANLYAQTITYGLFSSRYYSPSEAFSLNNLKTLNSNPLLKGLFANVTEDMRAFEGDPRIKYPEADLKRIKVHVEALVDILANTDMPALIASMSKTATDDVIIHFYETFLGEYDPVLRKELGIWYTPQPVVNYMIRGVDALLKSNFKLEEGLVDDSKDEKGNHLVQILDPATGTGNYLNSTIKYIKSQHKDKATWSTYVREGLIPRLHGLEILMTSYSIAHLKLNNTLKETGFVGEEQKFGVYLTNTLAPAKKATLTPLEEYGNFFLKELTAESNKADGIKSNPNIKVVIGNPPYNKKSKNNGKFIVDLVNKEYAQKGSQGALADDYIKFMRYAQNLVDQNGSGIVAYISNNSFLSSIAMTNMRKSLLKSFDEIYILDFQGEPKDNIFKIKQPVCISFFVKTSNSQEKGVVFYNKVEGSRLDKHNYCDKTSFNKEDFKKVNLLDPEYYFYPLEGAVKSEYTIDSFALDECFNVKSSGVKTNCDPLVLDTRQARLETKIDAYFTKGELSGASESVNDRKTKHGVTKKEEGTFTTLLCRPFDTQAYFDSDLTDTRCEKLRRHEQANDQVFLNFSSSNRDKNPYNLIFCTKKVVRHNFFLGTYNEVIAPLYEYSEGTDFVAPSQATNFKPTFIETLKGKNMLTFEDDATKATEQTFSSLDIMDYIYGWLHDTTYRATNNDFLKSNTPRVPYPKSTEEFKTYMLKGRAFRELHLSEGKGWDKEVTFKGSDKSTTVDKVKYNEKTQELYLTDTLSITITPEEWKFKIGACAVLESWLGYRKGDALTDVELKEFKRLVVRVRKHMALLGQ